MTFDMKFYGGALFIYVFGTGLPQTSPSLSNRSDKKQNTTWSQSINQSMGKERHASGLKNKSQK